VGAPGDNAGDSVVTGTGSNSRTIVLSGVTTATDAAFDTGDEVCIASGLVCVDTNDVLGTPIACTVAHVVARWLAFCK
jgi:hypothetical protein